MVKSRHILGIEPTRFLEELKVLKMGEKIKEDSVLGLSNRKDDHSPLQRGRKTGWGKLCCCLVLFLHKRNKES